MPEEKQEMDSRRRTREGTVVTLVGLWGNVLLTIGKYVAGILGHSGAMIDDASHSLSDLLTDFAVLLGLRYTSKPADEDHAYGHGRIETLTAAFCGLVLVLVGLGILFEGVTRIYHVIQGGILPVPGQIAFWTAAASIFSKEILYRYTVKAGQSPSIEANAWHHRSDAFSSIGALLGIGGSLAGGGNWTVPDPIAAVIVSFFILYAATSIFWHSGSVGCLTGPIANRSYSKNRH